MSDRLEAAKERLKEANLKTDSSQKVMALSQAIMLVIQELEEDNEMDTALEKIANSKLVDIPQPEAPPAEQWPWHHTMEVRPLVYREGAISFRVLNVGEAAVVCNYLNSLLKELYPDREW